MSPDRTGTPAACPTPYPQVTSRRTRGGVRAEGVTQMGGLAHLAHQYVTRRVRTGDVSKITAEGYRSTLAVLVAIHGHRPVAHLGTATIERWLEQRARLKPSTRATQWSQIKQFLDWLVDRGELSVNPCRQMRPPRRPRTEPRTIDTGDVAALLAVAPDARARAIIHLEVSMGARRVEVHRLRVEDWLRRDRLMRLVGKGGHERVVPVPPRASAAFAAYLDEHPATVGPFFRSYQRPHMPLAPSTIGHMMSDLMYEAGIKHAPHDGVSGHALRRTCASEVLDACGDLRVVQQLLGHAHLSSTSVYLRRANLVQLREAMECQSWERPTADLRAA